MLTIYCDAYSFPYSARATYTAVKNLFGKQDQFCAVEYDDNLFVVKARHGAFISPFSENIKVSVQASGTDSCCVFVESSSRSVINLLNFCANKNNVNNLRNYISNEVFKMQNVDNLVASQDDHSTIRFKTPDIKFK